MSQIYSHIRNFSDFVDKNDSKKPSSGTGLTFKLYHKVEKLLCQVKKSNSEKNKFGIKHRKIVNYDPDQSDIIGEYLATKMAYGLLNDIDENGKIKEGKPELSPEIVLVTDNEEILIASRYLNEGRDNKDINYTVKTYDDIYEDITGIKKHPKIVVGSPKSDKEFQVDSPLIVKSKDGKEGYEHKIDKKELFKLLKVSILLGDHDVNPGNMCAVISSSKDSKTCYNARIDYGHAFNDLIKNFTSDHSPNISKDRGPVLDFVNRKKLVLDSKSKLSRDYSGLFPDKDFINILREDINEEALKIKIEESKTELNMLLNKGGKIQKDCNKSLKTLSSRIGSKYKSSSNKTILDHTTDSALNFVKENQKEMKSVANLMEIQLLVDELIKYPNNKNINKEIEKIFKTDDKYLKNKNINSKVEWIRTDLDKKVQKCSLKEYIKIRHRQLSELQNKNLDNILDQENTILEKENTPTKSGKVIIHNNENQINKVDPSKEQMIVEQTKNSNNPDININNEHETQEPKIKPEDLKITGGQGKFMDFDIKSKPSTLSEIEKQEKNYKDVLKDYSKELIWDNNKCCIGNNEKDHTISQNIVNNFRQIDFPSKVKTLGTPFTLSLSLQEDNGKYTKNLSIKLHYDKEGNISKMTLPQGEVDKEVNNDNLKLKIEGKNYIVPINKEKFDELNKHIELNKDKEINRNTRIPVPPIMRSLNKKPERSH